MIEARAFREAPDLLVVSPEGFATLLDQIPRKRLDLIRLQAARDVEEGRAGIESPQPGQIWSAVRGARSGG